MSSPIREVITNRDSIDTKSFAPPDSFYKAVSYQLIGNEDGYVKLREAVSTTKIATGDGAHVNTHVTHDDVLVVSEILKRSIIIYLNEKQIQRGGNLPFPDNINPGEPNWFYAVKFKPLSATEVSYTELPPILLISSSDNSEDGEIVNIYDNIEAVNEESIPVPMIPYGDGTGIPTLIKEMYDVVGKETTQSLGSDLNTNLNTNTNTDTNSQDEVELDNGISNGISNMNIQDQVSTESMTPTEPVLPTTPPPTSVDNNQNQETVITTTTTTVETTNETTDETTDETPQNSDQDETKEKENNGGGDDSNQITINTMGDLFSNFNILIMLGIIAFIFLFSVYNYDLRALFYFIGLGVVIAITEALFGENGPLVTDPIKDRQPFVLFSRVFNQNYVELVLVVIVYTLTFACYFMIKYHRYSYETILLLVGLYIGALYADPLTPEAKEFSVERYVLVPILFVAPLTIFYAFIVDSFGISQINFYGRNKEKSDRCEIVNGRYKGKIYGEMTEVPATLVHPVN